MVKPLVSFVIPVFNSERDMARCLLSIRQLHCPESTYEVLIMDNGSTDTTHEIMRTLGFPFQVIPRVNVSTLRNRGAALARGDYLAFVDSDVELPPEWIHYGLAHLAKPQVVACGCCFPRMPPDATWVQQAWDMHQRSRQPSGTPAFVSWLPSMSFLVRRETFQAVAGFNEALITAEDVDLCYRLGQYGCLVSEHRMAAIHWGEDRDLGTFWRKEVWRGMGNIRGVQSHGLRWDELPSVGYPLYMLGVGLALALGCGLAVWDDQALVALLSLGFFVLPACLLACRTAARAQRWRATPQLGLLYFVYGLARAYAVLKSWAATRQLPQTVTPR